MGKYLKHLEEADLLNRRNALSNENKDKIYIELVESAPDDVKSIVSKYVKDMKQLDDKVKTYQEDSKKQRNVFKKILVMLGLKSDDFNQTMNLMFDGVNIELSKVIPKTTKRTKEDLKRLLEDIEKQRTEILSQLRTLDESISDVEEKVDLKNIDVETLLDIDNKGKGQPHTTMKILKPTIKEGILDTYRKIVEKLKEYVAKVNGIYNRITNDLTQKAKVWSNEIVAIGEGEVEEDGYTMENTKKSMNEASEANLSVEDFINNIEFQFNKRDRSDIIDTISDFYLDKIDEIYRKATPISYTIPDAELPIAKDIDAKLVKVSNDAKNTIANKVLSEFDNFVAKFNIVIENYVKTNFKNNINKIIE